MRISSARAQGVAVGHSNAEQIHVPHQLFLSMPGSASCDKGHKALCPLSAYAAAAAVLIAFFRC